MRGELDGLQAAASQSVERRHYQVPAPPCQATLEGARVSNPNSDEPQVLRRRHVMGAAAFHMTAAASSVKQCNTSAVLQSTSRPTPASMGGDDE